MQPQEMTPAAAVATGRIIIGALAMGVIVFAGIAVFLVLTQGPQGSAPPSMRYTLAGVYAATALGTTVGFFVIPGVISRKAGKEAADEATPEAGERLILGAYSTSMILRGALAEGPTLLAVVSFLLTGFWPMLAGVALGLVLLAAVFPSHQRLSDFTDRVLMMR